MPDFFLMLFVMFIFLGGIKEILILIIITLPVFSSTVFNRSYKKISGIYENGIIEKGFISWKEMFSWEILDKNNVSFTGKNGEVWSYMNLKDIDSVINIMEKLNMRKK